MNDIWSGFMKAYTLTLFENMKHSVWCNKSSDYMIIKKKDLTKIIVRFIICEIQEQWNAIWL